MIDGRKWTKLAAFALATSALIGYAAVAAAEDETLGTRHGASWLFPGQGARAIALQAFSPLAAGVPAITTNPAGLGGSTDTELAIFTQDSPLDIRRNAFGVALGYVGGENGSLGISWRNVSVGDSDIAPFELTDLQGNTHGSLGYASNAVDLAYGHKVKDEFQFGLAVGMLFDKFDGVDEDYPDDASASGFGGVTLGVQGLFADTLHYGLSARNLGGKLGEGEIAPTISAGVAVTYPSYDGVLMAAEIEQMLVNLINADGESTRVVKFGVEYSINPVCLRLGTSQSSDRSAWYTGIGVNFGSLALDYAYQLSNEAASSLAEVPRHFVSIGYQY